MKYLNLVLLLSLFILSCGKSSQEYEDLAKRYEESSNANVENKEIIDSLKKITSTLPTQDTSENQKSNVGGEGKHGNDNSISDLIPKPKKGDLLGDDFLKNYDYANYIKILPSTYFVTTLKNNINKNYICQLLKSVNGSTSKYIFIPTKKTIFDVYLNYNAEKTEKNILSDFLE